MGHLSGALGNHGKCPGLRAISGNMAGAVAASINHIRAVDTGCRNEVNALAAVKFSLTKVSLLAIFTSANIARDQSTPLS